MGLRNESLALWINGARIGLWHHAKGAADVVELDRDWAQSARAVPLSLSLSFPFGNESERILSGDAVSSFFDNLLPESAHARERLARRFGSPNTDAFSLLKETGRDCAGALQILPPDVEPAHEGVAAGMPLTDDEIAMRLRWASSRPAAGQSPLPDWMQDDCRFSLAGAQDKFALLKWRDRWCVPSGSTATTHILKLPMGFIGARGTTDFRDSVDNEWLCLKIFRAFGLETADADIECIGGQRVLAVERFDRRWDESGERLHRLPQEDFCQALGVPAVRKYESEGGPGLRELFACLQQSDEAQKDRRTLLASQILLWMLRSTDAHAKNFSLRLLPQSRFCLAPFYDIVSAWPLMGDGPDQWRLTSIRMAMALLGRNRHYHAERIEARHFMSTAERVGLSPDEALAVMEEIVAATPAVMSAMESIIPPGFSERTAQSILAGLALSAKRLDARLDARRRSRGNA